MGKAQKVEGWRLPLARWPELDELRFLWVEFQSKAGEPFADNLGHSLRILFFMKHHHQVASKADHLRSTDHSRFHLMFEPTLDDFMQIERFSKVLS